MAFIKSTVKASFRGSTIRARAAARPAGVRDRSLSVGLTESVCVEPPVAGSNSVTSIV